MAYARKKLTVYLTVSGTVTARDPQREELRSGAAAGTTTRGETR
ncbi:hypothetical protein [Streptomyces sp. NPDC048659]